MKRTDFLAVLGGITAAIALPKGVTALAGPHEADACVWDFEYLSWRQNLHALTYSSGIVARCKRHQPELGLGWSAVMDVSHYDLKNEGDELERLIKTNSKFARMVLDQKIAEGCPVVAGQKYGLYRG